MGGAGKLDYCVKGVLYTLIWMKKGCKLLNNFVQILFFSETAIDPGKEDEEGTAAALKTALPIKVESNSNRESPNCPDSTTSPSPSLASLVSTAASVTTASSTPTCTTASTGSTASASHLIRPLVPGHLALLPTLYSAYPGAAAGSNASPAAPATAPGIFSYIAAGLMPPPPLVPLATAAQAANPAHPSSSSFSISNLTSEAPVKRPVAHLAAGNIPHHGP